MERKYLIVRRDSLNPEGIFLTVNEGGKYTPFLTKEEVEKFLSLKREGEEFRLFREIEFEINVDIKIKE